MNYESFVYLFIYLIINGLNSDFAYEKFTYDLFKKKNTNFENMMKLFYKFELEIKVFDFGL